MRFNLFEKLMVLSSFLFCLIPEAVYGILHATEPAINITLSPSVSHRDVRSVIPSDSPSQQTPSMTSFVIPSVIPSVKVPSDEFVAEVESSLNVPSNGSPSYTPFELTVISLFKELLINQSEFLADLKELRTDQQRLLTSQRELYKQQTDLIQSQLELQEQLSSQQQQLNNLQHSVDLILMGMSEIHHFSRDRSKTLEGVTATAYICDDQQTNIPITLTTHAVYYRGFVFELTATHADCAHVYSTVLKHWRVSDSRDFMVKIGRPGTSVVLNISANYEVEDGDTCVAFGYVVESSTFIKTTWSAVKTGIIGETADNPPLSGVNKVRLHPEELAFAYGQQYHMSGCGVLGNYGYVGLAHTVKQDNLAVAVIPGKDIKEFLDKLIDNEYASFTSVVDNPGVYTITEPNHIHL